MSYARSILMELQKERELEDVTKVLILDKGQFKFTMLNRQNLLMFTSWRGGTTKPSADQCCVKYWYAVQECDATMMHKAIMLGTKFITNHN